MKQKGPWKIKSTKQIYKNHWMEVYEDQVINPANKDGIYGVTKLLDGICVVSIDDQNNLHLVNEFKYVYNGYSIEGVCGGIEDNHTALETVHKELKEELGIEAKDIKKVGVFNTFTSMVKCQMHLFIAKDLKFLEYSHEDTEVIEPITLPLKKAVQIVKENQIHHLPTAYIINYIDNMEHKDINQK